MVTMADIGGVSAFFGASLRRVGLARTTGCFDCRRFGFFLGGRL
jgi:hypothetical protein